MDGARALNRAGMSSGTSGIRNKSSIDRISHSSMTFPTPIFAAKANLEWPMSSIIMVVSFIPACFVAWKIYSKLEKPGLGPMDTDFKAFALAAVGFFATWIGVASLLMALFE